MNKTKLNNIMEEVLSHLDHKDIVARLKEEYTKQLLYGLKNFFMDAYYGYDGRKYIPQTGDDKRKQKAYKLMKDLVDDAVKKYMSKIT